MGPVVVVVILLQLVTLLLSDIIVPTSLREGSPPLGEIWPLADTGAEHVGDAK
jgi:hypothetical protein